MLKIQVYQEICMSVDKYRKQLHQSARKHAINQVYVIVISFIYE